MDIPVVDYILVVIGHHWLFVSPLQYVDAMFIDGQPQVLRECAGVALHYVKYGGPVERPLTDEGHVRFITLCF